MIPKSENLRFDKMSGKEMALPKRNCSEAKKIEVWWPCQSRCPILVRGTDCNPTSQSLSKQPPHRNLSLEILGVGETDSANFLSDD
jgi:hypothetical protein